MKPIYMEFILCISVLPEDDYKKQLKYVGLKGKAIPLQAWRVPGGWGSQISRQSAHEGGKVVSPTRRPPLPPGNIPGTHFCQWLSQPQGHIAPGRFMSMKISSYTIGNRTRGLPTCSAVPQATALPRARKYVGVVSCICKKVKFVVQFVMKIMYVYFQHRRCITTRIQIYFSLQRINRYILIYAAGCT